MSIIKFKGRRAALEDQLLILQELYKEHRLLGIAGIAVLEAKEGDPKDNEKDITIQVFWADIDSAREDLTYIFATGIDLLKHDFMEDNFHG